MHVILWAECWGKLEDTIRRTLVCEDVKYNIRLFMFLKLIRTGLKFLIR